MKDTDTDIPFNDWSSSKLVQGLKHSTWRGKVYGKRGDTFQHLNKRYRLIHEPFHMPLGVLIHYLYRLEGAENPEELTRVLCSIKRCKPEQLDMQELGWLHVFAEVG